jgi:DNA primase
VTLLYDGDKAGIKASIRGIDMLLEEGMNISVVLLPEGEDPDSYAQSHSTEEVEEYIERNKVDFIRFKTNLLLDEVGDDPIRRAGLIGDVVKSIAAIPNDILRSEYIKKCSEMLNVGEHLLVKESAKIRKKRAEDEFKQNEKSDSDKEENNDTPPTVDEFQQNIIESYSNSALSHKEKAIIQFILKNGNKLLQVPEDKEENTPAFTETVISHLHYSFDGDGIEMQHPLYRKVFAEAITFETDTGFNPEHHFMAHPDADVSRLAAELCGERYLLSKFFKEQSSDERNEQAVLFEQTTRLSVAYKLSIVDEMLKDTMKKMKDPATAANIEMMQETMADFKFLKETQQALNGVLSRYGFGNVALNT